MSHHRMLMHVYLGALMLAWASAAAVEDGVYELDRNGKPGKHVSLPVIHGEISSLSNANDAWSASVFFPQAGFQEGNRYCAVVAGNHKEINGWGKSGTTEYDFSLQLTTDEVEPARTLFGLPIHARRHPEHRIDGAFTTAKETYRPGESIIVTLVIRNLSDRPFHFLKGGHQRGPRDDQFSFSGEGPEGTLKIKSAMNFGGMSVISTIPPHAQASLSVDLCGWIDAAKPGFYSLMASYLLPIHEDEQIRSREIWQDYLTRPCVFKVTTAIAP